MKSKRSKQNFDYSKQLDNMSQQSPPRKKFGDLTNIKDVGKRQKNIEENILKQRQSKIKFHNQTMLKKIQQETLGSSQTENQRDQRSYTPTAPLQNKNRTAKDKRLERSSTRRDFQLQVYNIKQLDDNINSLLELVKHSQKKSVAATENQEGGLNKKKRNNCEVSIFDLPQEHSRNFSMEKQSQIISRFSLKDRVEKCKQNFVNNFEELKKKKHTYEEISHISKDFDRNIKEESKLSKLNNGNSESALTVENISNLVISENQEKASNLKRYKDFEEDVKQSRVYNDVSILRARKISQKSLEKENKRGKSVSLKKYTYWNQNNSYHDLKESNENCRNPQEDIAQQTNRNIEQNNNSFHNKYSLKQETYKKQTNLDQQSFLRLPSKVRITQHSASVDYQRDIDHEINKIKNRIKNSQETTREMQKKYLGISQKQRRVNDLRNKILSQNTLDDQLETFSHRNLSKLQKTTTFLNCPNSYNDEIGFQLLNNKQTNRREYNYKINSQQYQQFQKQCQDNNYEVKIYPCCYSDPRQSIYQIANHRETGKFGQEEPQYPKRNRSNKLDKEGLSKRLALRLVEQVQLDQKLRNSRQIFSKYSCQNKWGQLRDCLNKYGFYCTDWQLQEELGLKSSQSNPFEEQRVTENPNIISLLAKNYTESRKYWELSLTQTISHKQMSQCGYTGRQLDLDQRGYLTLEDFVCFMNLYTSNFFRNRDLYFTFRRFWKGGKYQNGVEYTKFIQKFC